MERSNLTWPCLPCWELNGHVSDGAWDTVCDIRHFLWRGWKGSESRDHLFFKCEYSRKIWDTLLSRLGMPLVRLDSWLELMNWLSDSNFKAHSHPQACCYRSCSLPLMERKKLLVTRWNSSVPFCHLQTAWSMYQRHYPCS